MNCEKRINTPKDHFEPSFAGGSVGGTPHSGKPFGRAILLGSQFSFDAALNR